MSKRKLQQYPCVKRLKPNQSVARFFPPNSSPNTQRDTAQALASIMIAVSFGNLQILNYHLHSQFSTTAASSKFGPLKRSLLHLAVQTNKLQIVKLVYFRIKPNIFWQDLRGNTPLDICNSEQIALFLKTEMNWQNRKALVFLLNFKPELFKIPKSLVRYMITNYIQISFSNKWISHASFSKRNPYYFLSLKTLKEYIRDFDKLNNYSKTFSSLIL